MTVGYSAIGNCYATQAEAIDAFYSSKQIQITNYGSGNNSFFFYRFQKYNGVWYEQSGLWHYATGMGQTYWGAAPLSYAGIGTCDYVAPSSGGTTSTGGTTNVTLTAPTGLPDGFDYTILGALFAFSFSVVVGLYFFGRGAGVIVNIFKPK